MIRRLPTRIRKPASQAGRPRTIGFATQARSAKERTETQQKRYDRTIPPRHQRRSRDTSPITYIDSIEEPFQELDKLVQEQASNHHNPPIVSADHVARALLQWQAWLSQHSTPSKEWSTDAMVTRIKNYQKQVPGVPLWIRRSFHAILSGYRTERRRSNDKNKTTSIDQADAFMEFILQDLLVGNSFAERPSGKTFELILKLHAQAGDLEGCKGILEFLLDKGIHASRQDNLRITTVIFDHMLQACVHHPKLQRNGEMADAILQLMLQLKEYNLLSGYPSTENYTQVVSAWAKSQDKTNGSKRVLQIWNYLNQDWQRRRHPLMPDKILTGAVLNALAQFGQAEQAEKLLFYAMSNDNPHRARTRPDISGFNAVLNAWSKAQSYHAGERAERLLRFLQQKWSQGNRPILPPPSIVTYTSVIHAWSWSTHPDAVHRANQLFQELILRSETNPALEPNTITYTSLLHTYAKGGEVARAAQLLGVMCTNYTTGKSDKAVPDDHCFALVLDAMAKSSQPESGQAAEELLRKMEASGMKGVSPSTFCFNIVMNAWVRSGDPDAGKHAERLLREMQEKVKEGNKKVTPGLDTYNVAINAWAQRRSAEDAERLLRELQDLASNPGFAHMKPDVLSYHSAMNAHAKDGNPEQTEALLAEMKEQGGRASPNPESIRLCMEAWARSGRRGSGEKADEYLELLERDFPKEKMHRYEMRFYLARLAWMINASHFHPRASQRLQEIDETLDKIAEEMRNEKHTWRRR